MIYIIFAYIYYDITLGSMLLIYRQNWSNKQPLLCFMRLDFAAIHRYFPQKILWSPPKEFVSSCLPTYLVICSCCVCHSISRAPASECNISTKYYNISILTSLCTHLQTNIYAHKHTQHVYTHSIYPEWQNKGGKDIKWNYARPL